LDWILQGKRRKERPRHTWRRTVHSEALEKKNSWSEVQRVAANRTEAAVASKTLVFIHQTEQHHIPVECNLHINSSDNIKSRNTLSALQNEIEEEMSAYSSDMGCIAIG
jgi:hypothetical protein